MKLSIIVATYNHEKFIRMAIESIRKQKFNFEYEVIIGDDCSTDGTVDILKELEKTSDSHYTYIYRDKNIGAEANFNDLYRRMNGDYYIVLEGDDYWIHDNKLQKQVDFLDAHEDFIACGHDVIVVDGFSKEINIKYPICQSLEYSFYDYLNGMMPGQTATLMMRNYYKNDKIDKTLLGIKYYVGDRRRVFFLLLNGRVASFNDKWSAYRYITTGGDSYSANKKVSVETHKADINLYGAMIKESMKRGNCDGKRVAEAKYFNSVFALMRFNRKFEIGKLIRTFLKIENKWFVIKFFFDVRIKKKEGYVV